MAFEKPEHAVSWLRSAAGIVLTTCEESNSGLTSDETRILSQLHGTLQDIANALEQRLVDKGAKERKEHPCTTS